MHIVRRALLISTADRYLALVVNFATVAAVSRILNPDEIGVSVIATAIIGIALSAREFASSSFLIQRHDLSDAEIRGMFSAAFALTMLLVAALWLLAPLVAAAYDEDGLVAYFAIISVCLILDLVSIQLTTLLHRDMEFGKAAIISISGTVIGSIGTIALALKGFGYMSFAWGWFFMSVVTCLLALYFRPLFWMFVPSTHRWRAIAAFGGYSGTTFALYRMFEMIPLILLGRVISPDASAIFHRSIMICQIPDKLILGGVMNVALPVFSAEARRGGSLKEPYLHALAMITVLHWPALLVLATIAHPVVYFLLGPQWHAVVPLVQIVSVSLLFSFSFSLNSPVLVANGSVRELFLRSLIIFPVSAAIVTVAIIWGGLHGAAWSLMIITPFHALMAFSLVKRRLDIAWGELWASVWKSVAVTVMSVVGPLFVVVTDGFDLELTVVQTAMALMLAALGWLGGVVLTRHAMLVEVNQAAHTLRGMVAQLVRGPKKAVEEPAS